MFKKHKKVLILCATFITVSLLLVLYLVNKAAEGRPLNNSQTQEDITGPVNNEADKNVENATHCTQDVMKCPDGSYVGRNPPDCNFSPCPDAKIRKR